MTRCTLLRSWTAFCPRRKSSSWLCRPPRETNHILSRKRIALLPEDAYVVNVGRGSAIDQEALMEALNGGHLAGAALDVCVPEPLPKDHPLWDTKNLLLTPTSAEICLWALPGTWMWSCSARICATTPPGAGSSGWWTGRSDIEQYYIG